MSSSDNVSLSRRISVGVRYVLKVWPVFLLLPALLGCAKGSCPQINVPDRAVPISTEAASRAAERVQKLLTQRGDMELRLTETEASSYLASAPTSSVSDPVVWFTAEGIYLHTRLGPNGDLPVRGRLWLQPAEHLLRIDIGCVSVAGRAVPRFVLSSLEEAVNDALADMRVSLQVERIVHGEGYLLIQGHRD